MGILFETLRYERKLSRETVSEIVGIKRSKTLSVEKQSLGWKRWQGSVICIIFRLTNLSGSIRGIRLWITK